MTSDQPAPARRLAAGEPSPGWGAQPQPAPSRAFVDAPAPQPVHGEAPAVPQPVHGEAPAVPQPAPTEFPTTQSAPLPAAEPPLQAPLPAAAAAVPDNPRTGEPRRPVSILIGSALCFAAVANLAGALLWLYWTAVPVPVDGFAKAAWLLGLFPAEPGSGTRVILVSAATLIALLIAVPLTITGYYSWKGYRWTRVSGLISVALSLGTLTLNLPAWPVILLAAVGTGLLWLPSSRRFFDTWQARRHPPEVFAPPTNYVRYGPAQRYRSAH